MGADYIIVDDPIKNQEEAQSPTYRNKVWNWYTSTLYPRIEGERAGVLVTLTRWHEDDLAGRLLRLAENNPEADQWEILKFPAVKETDPDDVDPRETGEPLWPDKFPLSILEKNKSNDSYVWNALFQQRPSAPEGNIIRRDWIHRFRSEPAGISNVVVSWDMTFKKTGSSWCVGQIWWPGPNGFYILHQERGKWDFTVALKKVIALHKFASERWRSVKETLIEDAANGPAIISSLRGVIPAVIPIQARESKVERLSTVAPMFEGGDVWAPESAPWVDGFIEELVSFPNAADDDQVDAASMALNRFRAYKVRAIKLNLDVGAQASPWRFAS